MTMVTRMLDGLFGRGEHAITIPAMDGALRPNSRLETAKVLAEAPGCDNLIAWNGQVVFSQGRSVRAVGSDAILFDLSAKIAFLATLPGGDVIAGCADGALYRLSRTPGEMRKLAQIPCPTAAVALDDDTLIVTSGSEVNGPADWSRDLLEKRRSGSVLRLDLGSGETVILADGLGWPAGVALARDGSALIVSEAWAARIISVPLNGGAVREVIGNLPGYPGHISHGAHGYWAALFAPRSQLVEFVLSERKFRERMMREIQPDLWVAPCLRAGQHFLEPIQAGGVRQLGVMKPWAPMRSFGLVLHLGDDLQPIDSFHSRADGARHGVTSVIETDGRVIFAAKGNGVIATIDLGVTE